MPTPEKIAHYRILRILGTGGMGQVYLAEDTRLGRHVALKILPPEAFGDSARRQAFHQEARAISALSHPNIITIFEIGSDGEVEFLATELVDGETLRDIAATRELAISEVVEIGVAVAAALVAAHEVGTIHRDIKPENVMLRRDKLVKVLDFGTAKLARGKSDEPSGADGVRGTIPYAAPEQLAGREGDARSDIWALGVLLYELLAGKPPWNGESPAELRREIDEKPIELLRRLNRAVPANLESIVLRCLKREPADRYQSAGAIAAALKDVQRELASSSRRIGGRGASQAWGSSRAGEPRRSTVPAAIAIAIMLTFLATATWLAVQRSRAARAYDSIAVLPFENRTGDESWAYLADGLTESLIHRLSTRSILSVTARSSVYRYQGSAKDPRQIGHELGVDAVLEGTLEQNDHRLVVRAELLDVVRGSRLWAGSYGAAEANLLDSEREIAADITEQLQVRLEGGPENRGTASAKARRYYLQGRYYWNQRTRPSFDKAIERFEKAIETDPSYAAAYAGIADVYNLLGTYGDSPPGDTFPRAKAAALRAVALDPTLPEAHTSLAYALQNYDWNWTEAEKEYRQALELNPSYATAHHWYGGFLMLMGRFDEAIAHRNRAAELDPLSPQIYAALGSPYLLARRYERAIELYGKAIRMDPNYARGHFALGWAYLHKGEVERGLKEIEIARKLSKGSAEADADLAYAYARAGDHQAARRILRELRQRARRRYIDPYEFVRIETALGDHEAAFADLERAWAFRSNLMMNLKVDPSLDPLRGDPRFQQLLERMNLDG